MQKNKIVLIVSSVVVAIVFFILIANLRAVNSKLKIEKETSARLSSELNAERQMTANLTSQVTDLKGRLSNFTSKYEEQVKINNDLGSLLDKAERQIKDLKSANIELKDRLTPSLDKKQVLSR